MKQNTRDARAIASVETQLKKLGKKQRKVEDAACGAASQLETLHSENAWIATEMQYWDTESAPTQQQSAPECRKELAALLKAQLELEKTLNRKAGGMLHDVEEQYNELIRKRQIIKRDKESILETIEGLKERQMVTIGEAYAKVRAARCCGRACADAPQRCARTSRVDSIAACLPHGAHAHDRLLSPSFSIITTLPSPSPGQRRVQRRLLLLPPGMQRGGEAGARP